VAGRGDLPEGLVTFVTLMYGRIGRCYKVRRQDRQPGLFMPLH